MIDFVEELNILMNSMHELMNEKKVADKAIVIRACMNNVIKGRMPDYELTILFSEKLGFITIYENTVLLNSNGGIFFSLNQAKVVELSNEQKDFLLRTCFLNGSFRKETRSCLKNFAASERLGTFTWSELDGIPLGESIWIAEHLFQLGLLERTNEGYKVNSAYVETVTTFLDEPKGWTEAEFEKYLKEKKEVGNLAEELVRKFEEERLKSLGYLAESHTVRIVGQLKVNAGYDVESFDGKSRGMNYDRFIEVKGSKAAEVRFFWTQNEMEVAKKLGKKYWIYYQGGIDLKNGTAKNQLILFQNPIETLMNDTRLTRTPQGLVVEGKIKGDKILL